MSAGVAEDELARDSALGRLVTQYGAYFGVARLAFGLGVSGLLLATVVKTWAIFDSSIALPVSAVIGVCAATIGAFYVETNEEAFRRIDANAGAWNVQGPVAIVAVGVALLSPSSSRRGRRRVPGRRPQAQKFAGVTAQRSFQRVVAEMEDAAAAKAEAERVAATKSAAHHRRRPRGRGGRGREARGAEPPRPRRRRRAERAAAERAAADKEAAERRGGQDPRGEAPRGQGRRGGDGGREGGRSAASSARARRRSPSGAPRRARRSGKRSRARRPRRAAAQKAAVAEKEKSRAAAAGA